ncbi:DUF2927 domain-containing protein [Pararhodobacter oceanensis]|uniref:DUF2927 domain-containing protein n=1 Tax=Pararhodobacter oceanensis TaxID=2172121 RepID=UPI003A905C49
MALAALVFAAGCASLQGNQGVVRSAAAPVRPAENLTTDPLSAELADYYSRIETQRVANNLMRQDSGADEVPLSASRLAQTYLDVALREEHIRGPLGFGGNAASVLRRWQVPVTYVLEFGPTVSRATRARDHREVGQLARRLARASGHPISLAPFGTTQGNFHVLVLSESERRASGPRLRELVPGIDDGAVRLITEMPRETFCLVIAFSRDGGAVYSEAVAVIRAEHPDLTRLACYHEELTQGLGLASDSDSARPSIFNDDQEFALITEHDLNLLTIHYNPRLRPGMTAARARPIVFSIASELAPGES